MTPENIRSLLIAESSLVREALTRIETNQLGVIFITNATSQVLGIATDGDLRRHLISNGTLDEPIGNCANRDFTWCRVGTPREELIKRLDGHVKIIPLLDDEMRLVDVASRTHLPLADERAVYARAKSPVRVSFGGGGSDLTHYFSDGRSGAVINAAVSLYSHVTLKRRGDRRIIIDSDDLGTIFEAKTLEEAIEQAPDDFGLFVAILKLIRPCFGFDLYVTSDFPIKSGLGGSATVSSAVIGCFNCFRQDKWAPHEIAELAYQAERHFLGVEGGWQDQYATVFGGFNFMEFKMDDNIIHPLRIPEDICWELEASLVLCNTGHTRESDLIHKDQRIEMEDAQKKDLVKKNVNLSYKMRNELLRGRLAKFGELLDRAWQYKRQVSSKITSKHIDDIYRFAMANGAIGGKLLGAGGGGYFLFLVKPFDRTRLTNALTARNLTVQRFTFEPEGLKTWTVRHTED